MQPIFIFYFNMGEFIVKLELHLEDMSGFLYFNMGEFIVKLELLKSP